MSEARGGAGDGNRPEGPGGEDAAAEDARTLTLDVFVQGEPVHRGARVEVGSASVRVGERVHPYEDIYWVSRRAGLLLLFARDATLALKGDGWDLDEMARAVERRGDRTLQRRLLQPVAREVMVCTAGTAVIGRLQGREVRGLHLAVFTRWGLHLLAHDRHHRLPWPVDELERLPLGENGEGDGSAVLVLRSGGDTELRIRYLFPEEIRAVERVASEVPSGEGAPASALELFARGEVAPPLPVRLPEFTVSVERLQELAERAAERAEYENGGPNPLRPGFLEVHFQELGETALGPLMLRRSAAAGAGSLARAVESMDAGQLQQDTRAAIGTALQRVADVYEQELERRLEGRRAPEEVIDTLRLREEERETLEVRVEEALQPLNPLFLRLFKRQELLRRRLEALERGPPDAGDEGVEEVAEAWREDLRRLDRALGSTWRSLLDAIAELWSERLLPRLTRAERLPPRRVPEWLWLAAGAVAALILAAMLVYLLIR